MYENLLKRASDFVKEVKSQGMSVQPIMSDPGFNKSEIDPVTTTAPTPVVEKTYTLVGPNGIIRDKDLVMAVQNVLSKQPLLGMSDVKVDGIWGPVSDKMLKKFQEAFGLTSGMASNGKLDEATYNALLVKAQSLVGEKDKLHNANLARIGNLSSL
jgi:peptidoglycan hydrolase-like protein with peptidoglycan-binding domain